MKKLIAVAVLAAALVGGGAGSANASTDHVPNVGHKLISMARINAAPPCLEEDANGCGWNAHTNGNGVGCSFYATKAGNLYYHTAKCRNAMAKAIADYKNGSK